MSHNQWVLMIQARICMRDFAWQSDDANLQMGHL